MYSAASSGYQSEDSPSSIVFVGVGSATSIDGDRREGFNKISAKGLAHGQPVNHNVDSDRIAGFTRSQPINRNILGRYSHYRRDSEDEFEDGTFKERDEYQSFRQRQKFGNMLDQCNCMKHVYSDFH